MEDQGPLWERFVPGLALGHRSICHAEVSSTMDTAWAALDAGAAPGTAFLALAQRLGRGRFQREWVGGAADSLLESVIVSVDALMLTTLSMSACVAVVRAVRALSGLECRLKWPNDVHIGGRKLCGILIESRINTDGQGVAVVGYGLNLGLDPERFPEIRDTATSLTRETGRSFGIAEASDAVLRELERAVAEAASGPSLSRAYAALVDTIGQRISVRRGGECMEGVAIGINAAGALLLRDDAGQEQTLIDGEVTLAVGPG